MLHLSDSTRRGLRTALQLLVTLLTTGAGTALLALLGVDVSPEQYATVTALLLPVITTLLNGLEDRGTIPAVLKAPPSPGADPVPDPAAEEGAEAYGPGDAGHADVATVLIALAAAIVVLAGAQALGLVH